MEKRHAEHISAIEVLYERKLAQESLYLEKMRQAYDEYVVGTAPFDSSPTAHLCLHKVHSRLDLQDVQLRTEKKIQDIEADKAAALREAEKQKTTLLQYFDYVKLRNDEILIGLEDKQEDERSADGTYSP